MSDIKLQTEAFKRYIKECDECSITPDYASAFNAAWDARAAIEAQRVPDVKATDQRVTFDAWLRSACFQAPPDHAQDLARSAWYASDKQASADCEAMAEEIERLQKALAFWIPDVPSTDHPLYKRVANDVYLLVGFDGPNPEQSAFELGHVVLSSAPPVAQPAEPNISLHSITDPVRRAAHEAYANHHWRQGHYVRMESVIDAVLKAQPAERKPLTVDQIEEIVGAHAGYGGCDFASVVRAVERHHGIGD